jgi:uncharacterized protein (TIGR02757 family)
MLSEKKLYELLEQKADFYNRPEFIETDPVSIPHRFSKKEDIEISGFFAATIAWGNRKMIIRNANRLMEIMDNAPYDFVVNHNENELKKFDGFVHRTFNSTDAVTFVTSLKNIYLNRGGLEKVIAGGYQKTGGIFDALTEFFDVFFSVEHLPRTQKHISNPAKGSAAKRMNMFLRWMVRSDGRGVDFGLWKSIPAKALMMPLDVHTARLGRKFGLLKRASNDRKAVEELTASLRRFDPEDPVKYDFALFGMGVFENNDITG